MDSIKASEEISDHRRQFSGTAAAAISATTTAAGVSLLPFLIVSATEAEAVGPCLRGFPEVDARLGNEEQSLQFLALRQKRC